MERFEVDSNLKPIIYPEVCIPQFLRNTRDRNRSYELDLDFKYNVVSLNCTRKPHRIDLLRALQGEERFIYSYYPFEDEDQINSFFKDDGEVELLNELTDNAAKQLMFASFIYLPFVQLIYIIDSFLF